MNPPTEATPSHRNKPRRKNYSIDRTALDKWTRPLPEDQRRLIFWLDDYAASRDLPLDELARHLKKADGTAYSRDSVYQAMTGRRGNEQLANFLGAIEDLKKIETARESITTLGFVETDITRRIFKTCETTRNFGKIGILIGSTHIGKTTALMEYADRNNHGATQYVRMTSGGGKSAFIRRLADQLNISSNGNDYTIGGKIIARFDSRMLLIVDEFHQCFPRPTVSRRDRTSKPSVFHTIEWLRELHDMSKVPILYSVTPVYDQIIADDVFLGVFKQTLQRAMVTCRLPAAPTAKSLNAFAAAFNLPPAEGEAFDLQTSILRADSLGRWISILEGASRIATNKKRPMDWTHVIEAHATLLRLENGE